jgi:hypothetical protein
MMLLLLLLLPRYLILIFLFHSLQSVWYDGSNASSSSDPISAALEFLVLSLTSTISRTSPRRVYDQLPQEADLSFDGVVLGEDVFECAYLIDVTGERQVRS